MNIDLAVLFHKGQEVVLRVSYPWVSQQNLATIQSVAGGLEVIEIIFYPEWAARGGKVLDYLLSGIPH